MIGQGGFGAVYEVDNGARRAALKVVPKRPGADRESLATELADVRNVIRIEEVGEDNAPASYLLLMPLAQTSLRTVLSDRGALPEDEVIKILRDVVTALDDLGRAVVHRDIKPDNVLLLGETWHLSDFGIARYAEAATATVTHKGTATLHYAPPEWWRNEHLHSHSDVYSTGVMAYELLTGACPFTGRSREELRDQHLTTPPAPLATVSVPKLATLVLSMLDKRPAARPTPRKILERLATATIEPSTALRKLHAADLAHVTRSAEETAERNAAEQVTALRAERESVAVEQLSAIFATIAETVEAETSGTVRKRAEDALHLRLSMKSPPATLEMHFYQGADSVSRRPGLPFEVIATAVIAVFSYDPGRIWQGRSHSLWYCDAKHAGEFAWYETAFADDWRGTRQNQPWVDPYARSVDDTSILALRPDVDSPLVAWPFTEVDLHDLGEFRDRWIGWFADAALGRLVRPENIPERPVAGSWRDGESDDEF
ncbi:serine/threonine-protein kinase [Nocardia sp. NPDC051833]|uniref:serine/threonine-protein kinase n=1 Tax=Nocardia sp. NPDC051833 TaxID=3155674 RepID=UPI00344344D1